MRKPIIISTILLTAAILTIFILFKLSPKPNMAKNGFNRKFLTRPAALLERKELNNMPNDIAGYKNLKIYFTLPHSGRLLVLDTGLNMAGLKELQLPGDSSIIFSDCKVTIGGTGIYLFASNVPAIYKYNSDFKLIATKKLEYKYNRIVPFSEGRFLLRIIDPAIDDQSMASLDVNQNHLKIARDITQTNGDGGFSTDGLLQYDSLTGLFLYSYFYSNGFVVFDSLLHTIYKGYTIDTDRLTTVYGKKLHAADGTHTFTMATAPRIITKTCCVRQGTLFCIAGLMADNEERDNFENNLVVDCYNINKGRYIGSFYLPRQNNEAIRRIAIYDAKVVVLYKNSIAMYRLPAIDGYPGN